MSGVEVAGFALAAFPLLISALEHYREGWEIMGDFWKIRKEYKKCQQDLKLQKLVFEENLEQLLGNLVSDEDVLTALIAKPGGENWNDPELENGLKDRLPRSYEVYLEIVLDILRVMESLKKELGLDVPAFQSQVASAEMISVFSSSGCSSAVQVKVKAGVKLEYQMQRVKFTFNKKQRNKLLEDLALYNTRLQKLLDSSDRLAASRQRRKKVRLGATKFGNFWQHAKNIYGLLKKTWCCDCLAAHRANLELQHRTGPEVELSVSFVFCQDAAACALAPWSSQQTVIRKLDESTSLKVQSQAQQPKSASTKNGLFARPALKTRKESGTKAVKWGSQEPSATLTNDPFPEIRNLCTTIATAKGSCINSECIGCLQGVEHKYGIYPTSKATLPLSAHSDPITLDQLLSKSSSKRLSRRQRYSLALAIASSHLQLRESPWLDAKWRKRDVLFPQTANQTLGDSPYISHSFHSESANSGSSGMEADRGMPSLGILLLELCFGTSLEDHEIRKNFMTLDGQPNPALDLVAAMQWCDRYANDEAGHEYAEAIKWCLRNPTMGQSAGKEQAWRDELFTQVIEPLQYCCGQLNVG